MVMYVVWLYADCNAWIILAEGSWVQGGGRNVLQVPEEDGEQDSQTPPGNRKLVNGQDTSPGKKDAFIINLTLQGPLSGTCI